MKLVGQFALGGFGIMVVITCVAFGTLAAQNGFQSSPGDLNWLLISGVFCGLLGAGTGVVLASLTLVLRYFFSHPTNPAAPPPVTDDAWPPPPVIPLPREQPSEDSAPE